MSEVNKNKTFMEKFEEAALHGRLPPSESEHLTGFQPSLEILSAARIDTKNNWADFMCVEKMENIAFVPKRGSAGAVGYDLMAFENHYLAGNSDLLVGLKIKIKFPPGVYGRIAPRSSMALRGITVDAGVVDPDYTGEIKVLLVNRSASPHEIKRGDKIAQLILEKYAIATDVKVVAKIEELVGKTQRGAGGFGSTGR